MRRYGAWATAVLTTAAALLCASRSLAQPPPPPPGPPPAPPPEQTAPQAPAQPAPSAQAPAAPPAAEAPPPAAAPQPLPSSPAAAPPAAPIPPPATPRSAPPLVLADNDDGTVDIVLDSPTPVDLIRRQGDNVDWWTVCSSPCNVRVPKGDQFMIVGKDIHRSKPFYLDPALRGRVNLSVAPGRKEKRMHGFYLLGGSGALALGGLIVLAAGITPSSTFTEDGLTHNENQTAIAVGSLMLVVAVTGGITGGAWAYDNSLTRVRVGAGANRFDDKQPPRGIPQSEPTSTLRAAAPGWMLPLFRGTF